ncbi:MAG: DNA (cytosine-5-)-methyltransferase, partial [Planctomycetes bacterium]|nr:DNA (cytosine-5-)-methyltransferase [Planctomycetota bacterium]
RSFTAREYARLQTFPDNWVFFGKNKRELQLQIGNAVPVTFAKKIADKVMSVLLMQDGFKEIIYDKEQLELF